MVHPVRELFTNTCIEESTEPSQYFVLDLGSTHSTRRLDPYEPELILFLNVMATLRKSCIPPLKHTSRPTRGKKSVTSNYRRIKAGSIINLDSVTGNSIPSWTPNCCPGDFSDSLLMLDDSAENESMNEPTEHELHCKSSIEGWNELRSSIRSTLTESAAMRVGQLCSSCPELATLRCQRCGPMTFFCPQCFLTAHNDANIFHVAETWQVG